MEDPPDPLEKWFHILSSSSSSEDQRKLARELAINRKKLIAVTARLDVLWRKVVEQSGEIILLRDKLARISARKV